MTDMLKSKQHMKQRAAFIVASGTDVSPKYMADTIAFC
jgi:hypothetical protein